MFFVFAPTPFDFGSDSSGRVCVLFCILSTVLPFFRKVVKKKERKKINRDLISSQALTTQTSS